MGYRCMFLQDLQPATEVRLILGDQLNPKHSWFKRTDAQVLYVMMETRSETDYVRHHVQKILAFFMAMRAFAKARAAQGHRVHYITLDDAANAQSISANLSQVIEKVGATCWAYQLPDEYRLDQELTTLSSMLALPHDVADTEHFLTSRLGMHEFFKGKSYLMERFYRHMRTQHQILMQGSEPLGERWNFDAENRNRYDQAVPAPRWPDYSQHPDHNIEALLQMLEKMGVETMGRTNSQYIEHALTETEAQEWLQFFVQKALPYFGTYEDAMHQGEPNLFHSRLSFLLNVKLLHPLEVVRAAEQAYHTSSGTINLAQVEGFVRQIIGWREYMRGVYWAKMPDYAQLNYFGHKAALPAWYWTGKTKMNCQADAINNSLDHAWAHHIQRLMVTGSFALLLGVNPDEVDQWYLGVYLDALEWVEITNTRGMSQYADGGIVGTKPYVSAAAYIDKMSNYCKGCHYDKKKRHGEGACPFNSLYWDFYSRHADKLARNPRIGMAYQAMKKMDPQELSLTLKQAAYYKAHADEL